MTSFPLKFVKINGADLAYREAGDPSNQLFITLHGGRGFGSHESDFEAYRPLSDRYHVVSFDFRGHGQSSFTPPYTFKQIVDDIEGLRIHFNNAYRKTDTKAVICGGSFGGFLAQQYAITYPDGLSHLILRGTAPSYEHEEEAFRVLGQRLSKAPLASINMLKKVFGSFTDDDEMRLVMFAIGPLYSEAHYDADKGLEASRSRRLSAKVHNDLYSEEEKYFDYRPKMKEIKAKTLIVVGAEDWICPPSQSQLMHDGIPGSQLLVVPDANHSVHSERNTEVIAAIRDFLS
ncbi:uncharacterized protein I303_106990 [Kwoniella dejecticola CBS 10117]|uniref:AB hydrolase-1 domain-containing protein n=1 Tax=Kwoniella dejecticola CBS 10117 TaxID=1296121 RepID=A0A1A5ZYF0_9TREE|nr:uncharacterized protein I303_06391 [Kwoniella dejecticola CBS 10117]OBR82834.1 hypothetical protein I303_06391 [Kwoniella dejecticola CBS 10117]